MKRFFAKLHLWLSLPLGLVIATVCLTGALLVFEQEIMQACHPSRYFVEKAGKAPLPADELMESARRQLPGATQLRGLRVFQDPERTWQVLLPGKKAAAFIDPYTGTVVGTDNGQGFFMQVMRLHRWLLDIPKRDGSFAWGKNIVGYATLAMVVILASGLVLWWPRNRKMLKNRLRIKARSGRFRFWYDLHVTGGFYAALFLLVMALTGLTWSFGWYNKAFYKVFGVEAVARSSQSAAVSGQSATVAGNSGNSATGKARNRAQSVQGRSQSQGKSRNPSASSPQDPPRPADYAAWPKVLAFLQNRYPAYNSITLQDGSASVSTAKYGNTRGSDRYGFDPATGTITQEQLYRDSPEAGKLRGWIYSVHTGSWGGLPTRILSFLAALTGGISALTGYYFFLRRKILLRKKIRTAP